MRHPILWTCGFGRLLAVAVLGFVAGCEFDDFLYDPSQVVTHNPTPVILPILTTLDLIDEPSPRLLGLSKVQAEDLIPEVREYVLGPGDVVDISIFELVFTDQESGYRRIIDELGTIRLPHGIGTVSAGGRTTRQLEQDIAEVLLEKGIMIAEPVVTVVSQTKNSEVFKIIGDPYQGTTRFGLYQITRADFRLLDAVALAGGIPGRARTLLIYRTVPLTAEVAGERPAEFLDGETMPEDRGSEPGELIPDDVPGLLEELLDEEHGVKPEIQPPAEPAGEPAPRVLQSGLESGKVSSPYVWVGGKWVKVQQSADAVRSVEEMADELMAQRIIEIPYNRLIQGDLIYNIIIRPGDVIKVPGTSAGQVYIGGQINRPGTYMLPGEKDLTLKNLVAAGGGMSELAIPQRTTLIRRIGTDQEAFIRLDLRKIFAGDHPDMFLKPNDQVNIGSNFFALPLAVIRNGFRMTYGFGFVLDRNFNLDVYGRGLLWD